MVDMKSIKMSPAGREALLVLGSAVRAGRLRRRWTVAELAERVGTSRPTLTKVEHGDPTVAIGTYFEAATLVGVPLFDGDDARSRFAAHTRAELALLPASARRPKVAVDDDF
jgi:transcriptional regulator with XRE-family HTH domain